MDATYLIELFFSGLTRGSIYALIALGYTMVYGIIGLINFAHGEIYMIGAFTAFLTATALSIYGFPTPAVFVITVLTASVWAAALYYEIGLDNMSVQPDVRRAGCRAQP